MSNHSFSHRAVAAALLLIASSGALAIGCSEDTTEAARDYGTLLSTVSADIATPAFEAAQRDADAQLTALSALAAEPTAANLQAAQAAWRKARQSFRALDSFTFGPMQDRAIDARIDATPADRSGIEKTIQGDAALDERGIAVLGGKKKGYLALETVLFVPADGGDLLTGFTSNPRRGQYAEGVAREIAQSAKELAELWIGDGKMASDLQRAGQGSARFSSQRAALDSIVGGGAYALELVVGIRLAMPMGRKTSGNPEPHQDPTLASDNGVADMLASMATVKALYEQAMSPMIKSQNAALDNAVRGELDACIGGIGGIPLPYGDSIVNQKDKVQSAFDACKALKLSWNTDVTSTLGATVKPLDTDGD